MSPPPLKTSQSLKISSNALKMASSSSSAHFWSLHSKALEKTQKLGSLSLEISKKEEPPSLEISQKKQPPSTQNLIQCSQDGFLTVRP